MLRFSGLAYALVFSVLSLLLFFITAVVDTECIPFQCNLLGSERSCFPHVENFLILKRIGE
jgi:hypothetical protein